MKSSILNHPANEPMLVVRRWMVEFCDNDSCAACLLSFFNYFHEVKLEIIHKNRKTNDIAEQHGDKRTQDETVIQFHTLEELQERLLGFFSINSIRKSLKYLIDKKIISVTQNPNPKYKFDRTTYYIFNVTLCNEWLKNRVSRNDTTKNEINTIEPANLQDRGANSASPSCKFATAIPKITNPDHKDDDELPLQKILAQLKKSKIPPDQLSNQASILELIQQGATENDFVQAIHKAEHYQKNGYGLPYVTKIVSQQLKQGRERITAKSKTSRPLASPQEYTTDLSRVEWLDENDS
ncbi:MAG: hypothetical protein KIT27_05485 [Legionellales bacterium]|nr:hypothetical protein [Legionellales bacterium]